MEKNNFIKQKVDDSFKTLDAIDEVKVNPFFKHKVLQKINAEKEVKSKEYSWFTPQLQLATLSIVLLLNISTVFYVFSNSNTTSDLETFAQEYSLQSNSNSLLN